MKKITSSIKILTQASEGNPVKSVVVIGVFWMMLNVLMAVTEKLIFGERFEHWVDPIVAILVLGYMALAVWDCAIYNAHKEIE